MPVPSNVPVASMDEPSLKETDPVGTGPPALVTAALKVTAWPLMGELSDDVRAVVDGMASTTCVSAEDVLEA